MAATRLGQVMGQTGRRCGVKRFTHHSQRQNTTRRSSIESTSRKRRDKLYYLKKIPNCYDPMGIHLWKRASLQGKMRKSWKRDQIVFHPKTDTQRNIAPDPRNHTSSIDAAPKNEVVCSQIRPVRCGYLKKANISNQKFFNDVKTYHRCNS